MRYPEKLKQNDMIGICAPSSGVPENLHDRLYNAIKNVNTLGYPTLITEAVKAQEKCVSASSEQRAKEFMELYENPEILAILPPWGGEFLMDVLPHINFDYISKIQPKWICGYSDITTLTFAMTLLCDIATIHGSNLMNMGCRYIHETDMAAFEAMSQHGIIQKSPDKFGSFCDFADIAAEQYRLDKDNIYKSLYGEKTISFSGRMIGGCIDVICKLIGTCFAPVNQFIEKYEADGFIWTLESCEMNAADIYRTFWQMRQCSWFAHCNGMIIGRPTGYEDSNDFDLKDALKQSFDGLDMPVIYDADIGHCPPQLQIVNGSFGIVDYSNGKMKLTQIYR